MKNITALFGVGVAAVSFQVIADEDFNDIPRGKTQAQYEHNYKTSSHKHGDSIKIIQKTDSNWSWELKFGTSNGNSNNRAYDDMVASSTGLVIQKGLTIDKQQSIVPSAEVDLSNNSTTWIGGASYNYKFNPDWQWNLRYRLQYKQISREDRDSTTTLTDSFSGDSYPYTYRSSGDVLTHRFETSVGYSGIKDWQFTFYLLYDYANYTHAPKSCDKYHCYDQTYAMYDNKKGAFIPEIKVQYKGFKSFIPYFEVDQVPYSGTSSKREYAIKTGVNISLSDLAKGDVFSGITLANQSSSKLTASSELSYEHYYLTQHHIHGGTIVMAHRFNNGMRFALGSNFINKRKDRIDDPGLQSTFAKVNYPIFLSDEWTVEPGIRAQYYSGTDSYAYTGEVGDSGEKGAKYSPNVALYWSQDPSFKAFAAYQYNLRKINRKSRDESTPEHRSNELSVGAVWFPTIRTSLKYVLTGYKGNYVMADNKEHDYSQSLSAGYRLNRDWRITGGIDDVAVSTTNDDREARVRLGFSYQF